MGATRRNQQALKDYYDDRPSKYDDLCNRIRRLDISDIERCLSTMGSGSIPGMKISAGSGFLAVLFPEWYGTVDQHTLGNIMKIDDDRAKWLRIKATNPSEFFSRDYDLAKHGTKQMISLYREKADGLNTAFVTKYWTPRKVEMVPFSLRS